MRYTYVSAAKRCHNRQARCGIAMIAGTVTACFGIAMGATVVSATALGAAFLITAIGAVAAFIAFIEGLDS